MPDYTSKEFEMISVVIKDSITSLYDMSLLVCLPLFEIKGFIPQHTTQNSLPNKN